MFQEGEQTGMIEIEDNLLEALRTAASERGLPTIKFDNPIKIT
ncbi:MAG: hypothetical protein PHY31_10250 [Smithellaceae bacterium]|nr:hypothetical protein [Smithellaceae bacterium]